MTSMILTQHEATVYTEETVTDSRGDVVTRPSATGVEVKCYISPRSTRADRDGSSSPIWSFMSPPDVPLGRWSKVAALGREFAVTSWPRLAGPAGSGVRHVECELVEQR